MKTKNFELEKGLVFAFEIENIYISLKKIAEILTTNKNVSELRIRKLFRQVSSDIHIKFKYFGKEYIVLEPYGDSSDYWVGPMRESDAIDILPLEKAFKQYQPHIIVRIFGGILSLDFKSLFSNQRKGVNP